MSTGAAPGEGKDRREGQEDEHWAIPREHRSSPTPRARGGIATRKWIGCHGGGLSSGGSPRCSSSWVPSRRSSSSPGAGPWWTYAWTFLAPLFWAFFAWMLVASFFMIFANARRGARRRGPLHSLRTSCRLVWRNLGSALGRLLTLAFLAVVAYKLATIPSSILGAVGRTSGSRRADQARSRDLERARPIPSSFPFGSPGSWCCIARFARGPTRGAPRPGSSSTRKRACIRPHSRNVASDGRDRGPLSSRLVVRRLGIEPRTYRLRVEAHDVTNRTKCREM